MGVLSFDQIAAVARQAGWPASAAPIAVAITVPEAGRNSSAVQQGVPYSVQGWGLWQITPGNSVPQFGIDQQMLNPLNNARAALFKWEQSGGFGPWTTFTHGLYLPSLAAATAAVGRAYKLSPAQLASVTAAAAAAGGGIPGGVPPAQNWAVHVHGAASQTTISARRRQGHANVLAGLRGPWKPPRVNVGNPAGIVAPVRKA